jgi:hypothetical protein
MATESGAYLINPNLIFKAATGGKILVDSSSPFQNFLIKSHLAYTGSDLTFESRSITTADATVTEIYGRVVPVSSVTTAWVMGTGKRVGANADSVVAFLYNGVSNNAGTCAVVGTTGGSSIENSAGTPTFTIVADDTNDKLSVRVTGIAAESWVWTVYVFSTQLTSAV